tara:strand:- start:37 stop:867 length:831 start_codon:yes stop_codon:yes gene_type:complete
MAQTSWPFENIDTSETQYSLLFRNVGEGVIPARGLELLAFADSTGMTTKVKTGDALVRGHYYNSTAETSLTISAANASLARIDRVVLRLDPSANTIILAVLEGVADASPSPAALTQTEGDVYEFPVALVAVGAGVTTIAPGNITDQRVILASTATLQSSITAIETDITALQTDVAARALLTPAVNAKTSSYTLVVGDNGEFITCSGTFNITIPSATFAAGDRVDFVNIGTGVITFLQGSGQTINSVDAAVTIDTQWAGATFFFTSSTAGVLIGRLA